MRLFGNSIKFVYGELNLSNPSGSTPLTITYAGTGPNPALQINAGNASYPIIAQSTLSTGCDSVLQNTSSSPTAYSALSLWNDGGVGDSLVLLNTSSTYNTALLTGAAAAPAAYMYTAESQPLVLGTNATQRIGISGAGNVSVSAPSSGVALSVNGLGTPLAVTSSTATGAITTIQNTSNATTAFSALSLYNDLGVADGLVLINTSSTYNVALLGGSAAAPAAYMYTQEALPLVFGTNATQRLVINADGGIVAGAATGGDQGAGTINATGLYVNGTSVGNTSGSFTATLIGAAGSLTDTIYWSKSGNTVTLSYQGTSWSGTGNSVNSGFSGLPSNLIPAHTQQTCVAIPVVNGASTTTANIVINNTGTVQFGLYIGGGVPSPSAPWNASGARVIYPFTVTYVTN